jgi:hypothetical protein
VQWTSQSSCFTLMSWTRSSEERDRPRSHFQQCFGNYGNSDWDVDAGNDSKFRFAVWHIHFQF